MKRKFLLLIAAIMLTTAIFTGCGSSANTNNLSESEKSSNTQKASASKTSYPVTFDAFDSEGKTYKQTFNDAPKKVITNNQSSTELLLTLGLKDSLIGTGDLDTPIPEALKDDYESIAAIAKKGDAAKEVVVGSGADLVIGRAASFNDDKYGSIPSLNEVGINTYVQSASRMDTNITLDTIIQDVRNVGIIFDVQDKANSLADSMRKSLDDIEANVPTNEARKKVIVIVNYGADSFSVYGANASLQTEMLNVLNADNVIEKGGSGSLENIISTNPDHIIYVTATKNASTDADAVSKILSEPTLQNVTAIKNKSIICVDYTEFMGYGYRTFDCLEKLSSAFYPEIFKK
ncbi:ABC transporter substrate-binding protein [Clostridium sp. YIM B02500]|uniref:ABC transporter substrate-binding protein n=1 Tax=Clostridium sp. YIM B02500 TaxID=2910681 RepID=UPI001EEED3E7|nr:ABC transporter substrate-binding protein [Clostridium sp. YIM B02500]